MTNVESFRKRDTLGGLSDPDSPIKGGTCHAISHSVLSLYILNNFIY